MDENNFQITIRKHAIIIRTIDSQGFPIDIWRFDRNNLSKVEKVFVDNIISMSKSMTTQQDERNKQSGD